MENKERRKPRQKGELKSGKEKPAPSTFPDRDMLIDDLRTHQVELDNQNEELRQIQEQLQQSESHYIDLYDYAPAAYFTIDTKRGTILEMNLTATKLLKISKEQVFKSTFSRFVQPEFADAFHICTRKALNEANSEHCELRLRRGDGSTFWALLDIKSEQEKKQERIAVTDISERKKTEDALKESEERFRTLSETSPVGVGVSSADGVLLYANPSYELILSYDHTELIGKKASELYFDPEDRQSWVNDMKKGVVVRNVETRLKRKDGTPIWVSINVSPILYDGKQAVMGTIQDIAERKKVEEELSARKLELESINKELESFAYSVSHDLKAPLRALEGFSEALLTDYEGKLDAQGKDYLNRIMTASKTMSQLIEDMLGLSRITRAEMYKDEFDISAVAKSIAGEIKTAQPERQVELAIQPGLKAYGDMRLIGIALRNLLENSWKFTAKYPKARIEFGAEKKDGKTAYYVKDNGVGFDMKYSDKLFQPFRRLHSEKEFPGMGIGLATVQRIIRRHGGHVWAEAELGKGATFYFTLGRE